jgi:ligand-binding sensor domain-containing protein
LLGVLLKRGLALKKISFILILFVFASLISSFTNEGLIPHNPTDKVNPTSPVKPTLQPSLASTITSTPALPKAKFPSGWTTYTNANENVGDIAFDQHGFLWAASQGGLVKWNTSNGTYKKFTTADGLPANRIDAVFVAKNGTVWVGVLGNILSYDGNKWEIYKYPEKQSRISQIFQDGNGKLWFVGDGVSTFNGKIWKTYTMEDGLGSNSVASITEDNQGGIWLGTWFWICGCEGSPKYIEGVSRFNGQKWNVLGKEIGLDDNDPASGIKVNAMAVDNKGGIWFGTSLSGAIYFDGKTSKTFTVADGLADNTITDIKIADDGTVWFATWHGLTSYSQNKFNIFPETNNLMIHSVEIAPDKSIWFGTDYGIFHLIRNKLTSLITSDNLPSTRVSDIDSNQQGAVWIGTLRGAVYTDGAKWQSITKSDGLPSNEVDVIRIAPDGTLWIGTGQGLAHLVNKTWSVYHEGRFDYELYDLVFDKSGGLWVSSYDLHYFDGIKWTKYVGGEDNDFCPQISRKLAFSPTYGIWTSKGCVFANRSKTTWQSFGRGKTIGWDVRGLTIAPDGHIWFASELSESTFHTETGFKSFDGTNWKLETKLNLSDVTDMDFSKDGILWVATRDGAYKYDGDNWTHYTIQDGLAGNEVTSIHVAGDGAIWFMTSDGLTRFGK